MKAGSVGSIPDDATRVRQATQPLRYFLREVGEAVANLNTTVVGLDAVEKGHKKPNGLNISWSPTDQSASARKARRFVLEAVLVRVSESTSQYVNAISKLPRFNDVRKSWEVQTKDKRQEKPTGAQKLADIAGEIVEDDCFLVAGGCLLIHWRNRTVHPNSKAKLTSEQIRTLTKSSNKINEEFSSLSIERLMLDFEKRTPTLKDITSLISMTIRLSRKIDAGISDASQEDLQELLLHYGLNSKIEKIRLETSPKKQNASIIRFLETTAPGLAEPYRKFNVNSPA